MKRYKVTIHYTEFQFTHEYEATTIVQADTEDAAFLVALAKAPRLRWVNVITGKKYLYRDMGEVQFRGTIVEVVKKTR